MGDKKATAAGAARFALERAREGLRAAEIAADRAAEEEILREARAGFCGAPTPTKTVEAPVRARTKARRKKLGEWALAHLDRARAEADLARRATVERECGDARRWLQRAQRAVIDSGAPDGCRRVQAEIAIAKAACMFTACCPAPRQRGRRA